MNRFITAVVFCTSMLGVLSFVIVRSSQAKEDIIQVLLDLPAPPPPNQLSPPPGSRTAAFFDKKNPPGDDAPIEDLLEYWEHQSKNYRELGHNIFPSERSLDRILEAIRKAPSTAGQYVKAFKGSARAARVIKEIYDAAADDEKDLGTNAELREWLKYNSPYFAADLSRGASAVVDANEYVTNQDDLLSLTRHDWERAKGHVNRLYGDAGQPTSQVLAKWALYRRALDEDSIGDIDRYRAELKAVVENRSATDGQRDLALDALVKEKDWPGRDDWYFSLFEDETLGDLRVGGSTYTGLTTLIYYAPEGKYAEKMAELAASKKPAVRAAAVRNLVMMISPERPEVIKALLPWLEDPKWAVDIAGSRRKVIEALEKVKIPESVPGLLAVLDERETRTPADGRSNSNATLSVNSYVTSNVSANAVAYATTMDSNSMLGAASGPAYPYRASAIAALSKQGDIRAAGPLRRVFSQVESYQRQGVVEAIFKSGGFSTAEQLAAVEAQAGHIGEYVQAYEAALAEVPGRPASNVRLNAEAAIPDADELDGDFDPDQRTVRLRQEAAAAHLLEKSPKFGDRDDLQGLLGSHLMSPLEVNDDLARAAIKRVGELEKSDPVLAGLVRSMVSNWKGRYVALFMLSDLKAGRAVAGVVLRLLIMRKELRESEGSAVADVQAGVPSAAGFAACLLESEADYLAILAGPDAEAKKALLACGRLIRAPLPVPEVATLLQSPDKQLALAAERFLESEDSPEARRIVLSLHPNEALILGATVAFRGGAGSMNALALIAGLMPGGESKPMPPVFGQEMSYAGYNGASYLLRGTAATEKKLRKEVLATADLLGVYAYDNNFIRIYKDKAVFSWEEDRSRYRERTLEAAEFDGLKNLLADHNADGLAPFLSCSNDGRECEAKQLVMLSRHGGRRVFFLTSTRSVFQATLESILEDFRRPPAKLRYWLEKDIPGVEILYADDALGARAVWKDAGDLRVLITDPKREKEIEKEIEKEYSDDDTEEGILKAEAAALDRVQKRKYDHYSWRALSDGQLGEVVMQPADIEYIPMKDGIEPPAVEEQWKARAGNVELRGGDGLFRVAAGRTEKLFSGHYSAVSISADGKWAAAFKSEPDGESSLVRIDLARRRESKVASTLAPYAVPIAHVGSIDRFLISQTDYSDTERYQEPGDAAADGRGSYFWLDPATGTVQPAAGELRPIAQQRYKRLQPAGAAFEYWAAIPDARKNETVVGIYSTRSFKMTPVMTLPAIQFNSEVMWVDGGKLYFVYNGHVISVPVSRSPAAASPVRRVQ